MKFNIFNNQKGSVTTIALLVTATLTIMGYSSTQRTSTEIKIAANDRAYKTKFFNNESGLVWASTDYKKWLTNAFFLAGETAARYPTAAGEDNAVRAFNDSYNGRVMCRYKVRCIEDNGPGGTITPIFSVGGNFDVADDLPPSRHIDPPPPNSGYSLRYFETRKYGITVTAVDTLTQNDTNNVIQIGTYKVFNKFD